MYLLHAIIGEVKTEREEAMIEKAQDELLRVVANSHFSFGVG